MKRTIEWPPRVVGGRLRMTAAPDDATVDDRGAALRQIIALSLLDGSSGNPWNRRDRLGVTDPTFNPRSDATLGRIKGEVTRQFERLEREKRARLADLQVTAGTAPGTLAIRISYIDLETQLRQNMEIARNG